LNPGWIIGSLLFSVVGLFLMREGKRQVDYQKAIMGIILMFYSYFISSTIWVWVVGILLTAAGYIRFE
jgi:hypothetical protein